MTPEQLDLFRRLMGGESQGQQNLQSLYESLGSNEGFDAFFRDAVAAPATRQFQEKVLPGVRREFQQSLFGSGRQNRIRDVTERFGQTMGETRAALAEQDLTRRQGLQAQIGTQQQNVLAQILGIPQQENIALVQQGSEGLMPSLLQAGGSALSSWLLYLAMQGGGAAAGAGAAAGSTASAAAPYAAAAAA